MESKLSIIKADNVILRPVCVDDVEAIYEIYSNEKIFYFMPGKAINDKKAIVRLIKEFEEKHQSKQAFFWGVCLKDDPKKIIGIIELYDLDLKVHMISIGYRLNERFWGKGIMTAAVKAMVDFLFYTTKVKRIQAFVLPINESSKHILHKNGFEKEGVLRQAQYWEGKGIVDVVIYSILRDDINIKSAHS